MPSSWIFFLGDVLMTGRLLFVGAFAIFDRLRQQHYGTPDEAASYQTCGRGADSGLQRRKSDRAHGARRAGLGLSRPARDRD